MYKQVLKCFLIYAVCSVLFTYTGQKLFGYLFLNNNVFGQRPLTILFYIFVWPSLLLDSVGVMITNRSYGYIPNAIGWGLLGVLIFYIFRIFRKIRGGCP